MNRWLCVLILLPLYAHGAGVGLRDLHAKDDERLKKELPALFRDGAGPAVLDEAIRLLMESGAYENVFAERRADGGYDLIGKPVRTVEAVEFAGAGRIDEGELRTLIEIKPGERFDRKKAVAAGEKIKTFYGERGFFNTVVEVSFDKLPTKNIKLVFRIEEKAPCLIEGLQFQTANADLRELLDARFRDLVGKPLTTDRARRLHAELNELLVTKRYLAAEVSGPEADYDANKTKAWLKFEVREPWRWEFYMKGYQFFTLSDLYHTLDLMNRERKNVDPAGEGAERLRRAYLEAGFPNVQIDIKIFNPPGTYLKRVHYGINEGPRVRLKAIEVQGRISRPSRYYETFVRENSSDLISRGWYSRQDLENGFKNLVTDLRNQGFLRARVLSSRVEFNEKRDKATVFLLLDEGPQTQVRALDFDGNRFFSSFELAQVTGLETNGPLHLPTFEAAIEKLKSFYQNQGFLEMKILNEKDDIISYNDKGTQAKILFRIYEGPRIRVHTIAVEGNTITQTRVILKETDFHRGEILTPAKLEDATARLNRLGLFSRVDIHTLEEGTNVAERTLVITVADRDPGIFRMGAGLTNERNLTVRGFTGVSYSNIGGSGRGVSLRGEIKQNLGQINYPEHEITASYLEPFVFNTRTRGRVNLTRSEHVFNYEVKEDRYKITQLTTTNRVDLTAERDLTLHTKLTWKVWGLESNTAWERNGYCVPEANQPFTGGKCPSTTLQAATLGPTLDIDYRDSAFLPTKGSFTRFVLDYSSPSVGSSRGVHFYRSEGNFTHYTRLVSPNWIWANSIRGGYERNLSGDPDSGIPTNFAFLMGGIYTVRGFDVSSKQERIPAEGNDGFTVENINERLIKTWSSYYLLKTELRFPIYGDHGGVLFYDGAEVAVGGFHFRRPYRDAAGFGYRYNTPVGPLALDFAFKISPLKGEEAFRFHLSIGTF